MTNFICDKHNSIFFQIYISIYMHEVWPVIQPFYQPHNFITIICLIAAHSSTTINMIEMQPLTSSSPAIYLEEMPNEIIIQILQHLPFKEMVRNVSPVSKRFEELSKHPKLVPPSLKRHPSPTRHFERIGYVSMIIESFVGDSDGAIQYSRHCEVKSSR